jgi:hypothetical protein
VASRSGNVAQSALGVCTWVSCHAHASKVAAIKNPAPHGTTQRICRNPPTGAFTATASAPKAKINARGPKIFGEKLGHRDANIYPASTAVTTHNTGARRAEVAGRGGGGSGAASGMTRPIQAKPVALPIIIFGEIFSQHFIALALSLFPGRDKIGQRYMGAGAKTPVQPSTGQACGFMLKKPALRPYCKA